MMRLNQDLIRRRDKVAKQKALLSAATSLFARKGYAATRTSEVAALAGCAEGLIHRYFGGKPRLLRAILTTLSLQEDIFCSKNSCPRGSLSEKIRRQVKVQLDQLWEGRKFLLVGFSQAFIDPEVAAILDTFRHKRENLIARDLRHHAQGLQLKDRDIETIAKAITALTFVYGFIRPVVLKQNRNRARHQVLEITELMARNVQVPKGQTGTKRSKPP